jgi:hypothetical protein
MSDDFTPEIKNILKKAECLGLHIHEFEDDDLKYFPSYVWIRGCTHYVMKDADIVYVGWAESVFNFIKNLNDKQSIPILHKWDEERKDFKNTEL